MNLYIALIALGIFEDNVQLLQTSCLYLSMASNYWLENVLVYDLFVHTEMNSRNYVIE